MTESLTTNCGLSVLDHLVTSGTFSLDGSTWEVDNNFWLLGDEIECVVIDAPHDADAILAAVGPRRLTAILCTHAHDDHIDAARSLADATGASAWLHPADQELWDMTYPDWVPDRELADGQKITVAGAELRVLHTPGHSRGAVCFHLPDQGWLFSGDTLFSGGPGATGRSFSDFGTIIASIRDRLLVLDPGTVVHTGHGTAPRSARRHRTWTSGSPAATDQAGLDYPAAPAASRRTLAQVAPQQAGDLFAGLSVSVRAWDGRQPFAEALVAE